MSISRIKDPNIGLCPSKCLMFLKTSLNIFWFLIVCFAIQSNFLWKLALLSYLKLLSQIIVWLDFLYKLSGDQKLIFHSFVWHLRKYFLLRMWSKSTVYFIGPALVEIFVQVTRNGVKFFLFFFIWSFPRGKEQYTTIKF